MTPMNPAAAVSFRIEPQTLICPRIARPPLDGRVDEHAWRGALCGTVLRREDNGAPVKHTTFWLGHDEGYLYLAARCDEPNTDKLEEPGGAYGRDIWFRDHVVLLLDPAHDHATYFMFCFAPFNQTIAQRGTHMLSYRAGFDSRWMGLTAQRIDALYHRYGSHVEAGVCWSLTAAVPFESVGMPAPQSGAVWGINLARRRAWPVFEGKPTVSSWETPRDDQCAEYSALSLRPGHSFFQPLAYADLALGGPEATALVSLDLGQSHFGRNRLSIRLASSGTAKLSLHTQVRSHLNGHVIDDGKPVPLCDAGTGQFTGEADYRCTHYDNLNVLDVSVRDEAAQQPAWRGSLILGFEAGTLPLRYRYREDLDGQAPPNPSPDDPEFLCKKAEFIAGRQHHLVRRNTAQGAPSDFTLASVDGTIQFNLMQPGVMDAMAAYVHRAYDNDADRLVGLMFLIGQQAVMCANAVYDPGTTHRLDPLSVLRLGSGYCGHMAAAFAAVLNRMEIGHSGRRHRARCFGMGGHAVVFAEYRGDYAVLDSKNCCLYYTLDNADLATLQEIRREPEIVRRSHPHFMAALMTFDERYLRVVDPEVKGLPFQRYPAEAPTE